MFTVKKNWQLQLQVCNICHIHNMFRTRCLSPMYCVNLAETSHTHRFIIINIIINIINNNFFPI